MKILSINVIHFGMLSNYQLNLDRSLHIIEGENETGKSTKKLRDFVWSKTQKPSVEFRTRFSNIEITSEPIITYKLYCANTIEENLINKQQPHKLIKIINNNDKFIEYDENSGNIIL